MIEILIEEILLLKDNLTDNCLFQQSLDEVKTLCKINHDEFHKIYQTHTQDGN